MENENETKNECLCKKKWFQSFVLKFVSVYLGVLCALCTFWTIHKPPIPPCMLHHHKMMIDDGHFYKKMHDIQKVHFKHEFDKAKKEMTEQENPDD